MHAGPAGAFLATGAIGETATELQRTSSFSSPESVEWDAGAGLFYVSKMGADRMAREGDGYIGTLGADGAIKTDKWVTGLDAPKGMAVVGGKLYAADVGQLVEIEIASASATNRYPAEGSVLLNDVFDAPGIRIFVSDTLTNSVWMMDSGAMSIFAQDPMLLGANGLTHLGYAMIVANVSDLRQGFENVKPGYVISINLATKAIMPFGSTDPSGVLGGIKPDGTGGVLVTDFIGGRVLRQAARGMAAEVAKLETSAADIEFVLDQGLIVVPLSRSNTIVGLS